MNDLELHVAELGRSIGQPTIPVGAKRLGLPDIVKYDPKAWSVALKVFEKLFSLCATGVALADKDFDVRLLTRYSTVALPSGQARAVRTSARTKSR